MDKDLARAVRRDLRGKRRIPTELRWTMAAAGVALAAWASVLGFAFLVGRGGQALQLAGTTLAIGREPAMLSAYAQADPLPLWLVALLNASQDAATVLVSLVALAFAFRRLRQFHWIDRPISTLEREAVAKRHWVQKWGVWAVAGFYFLPGFGSGAIAACLLGLLAGLPLRKLAVWLTAAGVAVSLFWAVALSFASALLPSGPWSKWLPLAFLGLVAAGAAWNAWRHRGQPSTMFLGWDVAPRGDDRARLEAAGLRVLDTVVEVNLGRFARAVGIPRKHTPTLRTAAKLALVHGMDLRAARALAEHGVTGVRDLALLDPALLREVVAAARVRVPPAKPRAWRVAAQGMARRHPV
ncbi:MAG: hypothetical protein QOD77_880 [Thermoplasmata archaeon]|jgi:uncharacterized membrane protein|nr:hypothetical protein [Thermoplasmata archaeon]